MNALSSSTSEEYNSNLIDTVWYNLDNTSNITINTSFYFQTSLGEHNLYLYGNQTNGTILSDEVTFSVQEAPEAGGSGGNRPKEVIIEEEIIKEIVPFSLQQ